MPSCSACAALAPALSVTRAPRLLRPPPRPRERVCIPHTRARRTPSSTRCRTARLPTHPRMRHIEHRTVLRTARAHRTAHRPTHIRHRATPRQPTPCRAVPCRPSPTASSARTQVTRPPIPIPPSLNPNPHPPIPSPLSPALPRRERGDYLTPLRFLVYSAWISRSMTICRPSTRATRTMAARGNS